LFCAANHNTAREKKSRKKELSSLYVCMAIKHIIVLFVETPRKFITAKLSSIRKPGSSSVLIICIIYHIISTDEDPGVRIESFAVINLRGVSTNKTIIKKEL
jgi:hypothetical protein